jgi:type III pantothenate kinase
MEIFCVDIGNTHTHFGRVSAKGVDQFDSMPSRSLETADHPILRGLAPGSASADGVTGFACCSVVPKLTATLRNQLARFRPDLPQFQFTHQVDLGFPLTHPHPAGIGQDRLANAVAAHALCGAPTIVVDSGTAVTCDVITPEGGFEGGIIAPGLGLLRDSLHEKTAQLPRIEDDTEPATAIGRSTVEAMQIGCTVGFRGLVAALVAAQRAELAARGLVDIPLVLTGGSADRHIQLIKDGGRLIQDLTLRGLYQAYLLNHSKGKCIPTDTQESESGTA